MNHSQIKAGLDPLDSELADWVRIQWRSFLDQVTADDLERLRPCLGTLPRVWAASEFIARTCVTQPRLLNDLVISGDLFNRYPTGELTQSIRATTAESEAVMMQNLEGLKIDFL